MAEALTWDALGRTWDDAALTWDGFLPAPPTTNHIMSDDNRVSASISAQDITDINAAIQTIRTKLPFLVSISNQERQEMAKLGDKSMGFDEKCAAYMASNPEFLPGFVLPVEVNKDRALRAQVMQFFPNLQTLCEAVDDTLMVVNSEIWMADLSYYQNVRQAAKRGRPGTDTIYGELRTRFPGGSASPATPPPNP